jgi:CheY-like chemotaxis protein
MTRLNLSPYFHPTSIVLVDDNEAFLRSLTLEMPPSIAFHGFTDPEEALEFLHQPIDLPPLVDRCFTLERMRPDHALIRLDLGLIEQEINYLQRFRRVSVVLVDYAMPSVNGLQFCERITERHARRALLTGVADEKLAVEAFNAGLIHRFIHKHRAQSVEALVAFMAELEREYFRQYLDRLTSALAIDPPPFLIDPAIAVLVQRLLHEERLVEYYLVDGPPGLLMLRADGSALRLVLLDETEQRGQVEFAHRFDAPAPIRHGLEAGELVGLFGGDSPADYFGDESYPWEERVVPARRLDGRRTWRVGLARDATTDVDFDPARCCYDAYLATLRR